MLVAPLRYPILVLDLTEYRRLCKTVLLLWWIDDETRVFRKATPYSTIVSSQNWGVGHPKFVQQSKSDVGRIFQILEEQRRNTGIQTNESVRRPVQTHKSNSQIETNALMSP